MESLFNKGGPLTVALPPGFPWHEFEPVGQAFQTLIDMLSEIDSSCATLDMFSDFLRSQAQICDQMAKPSATISENTDFAWFFLDNNQVRAVPTAPYSGTAFRTSMLRMIPQAIGEYFYHQAKGNAASPTRSQAQAIRIVLHFQVWLLNIVGGPIMSPLPDDDEPPPE